MQADAPGSQGFTPGGQNQSPFKQLKIDAIMQKSIRALVDQQQESGEDLHLRHVPTPPLNTEFNSIL